MSRFFPILALILVLSAAPAFAIHPGDLPVIKQLAHELVSRAQHAHHAAEQNSHHFSWWERQLLANIHHTAEDGEKFHRTVESYFSSPHAVEQKLQHVNRWARLVDAQIHHSHAFSHALQDWQKCARALDRINVYFYGNGGGHGNHPVGPVRETLFDRLHAGR